ncbi:MAG: DoxX family protein [Deltaproteobacteria bacterium]|nr:DoxX family protein [Deltaproteobacteria bacterium]
MFEPELVARLLVTAFFAVAFLQSAIDKLVDRDSNLAYFNDHFKNSPLADMVPLMLKVITAIEATAGGLCTLGLLTFSFRHRGVGVAELGVCVSAFALICLFFGQRAAKDYAGAAVIAAYFAVALLGLSFF